MNTANEETLITPWHEGDTGMPSPSVGDLRSSTVNDLAIANEETLQNMNVESHNTVENEQQVKVKQIEIESQEDVNDNMYVENGNKHNNVRKQVKFEQGLGDKETSTQPTKKKIEKSQSTKLYLPVVCQGSKEESGGINIGYHVLPGYRACFMPEQWRQILNWLKIIMIYWHLREVTWLLQCTNTINKKD